MNPATPQLQTGSVGASALPTPVLAAAIALPIITAIIIATIVAFLVIKHRKKKAAAQLPLTPNDGSGLNDDKTKVFSKNIEGEGGPSGLPDAGGNTVPLNTLPKTTSEHSDKESEKEWGELPEPVYNLLVSDKEYAKAAIRSLMGISPSKVSMGSPRFQEIRDAGQARNPIPAGENTLLRSYSTYSPSAYYGIPQPFIDMNGKLENNLTSSNWIVKEALDSLFSIPRVREECRIISQSMKRSIQIPNAEDPEAEPVTAFVAMPANYFEERKEDGSLYLERLMELVTLLESFSYFGIEIERAGKIAHSEYSNILRGIIYGTKKEGDERQNTDGMSYTDTFKELFCIPEGDDTPCDDEEGPEQIGLKFLDNINEYFNATFSEKRYRVSGFFAENIPMFEAIFEHCALCEMDSDKVSIPLPFGVGQLKEANRRHIETKAIQSMQTARSMQAVKDKNNDLFFNSKLIESEKSHESVLLSGIREEAVNSSPTVAISMLFHSISACSISAIVLSNTATFTKYLRELLDEYLKSPGVENFVQGIYDIPVQNCSEDEKDQIETRKIFVQNAFEEARYIDNENNSERLTKEIELIKYIMSNGYVENAHSKTVACEWIESAIDDASKIINELTLMIGISKVNSMATAKNETGELITRLLGITTIQAEEAASALREKSDLISDRHTLEIIDDLSLGIDKLQKLSLIGRFLTNPPPGGLKPPVTSIRDERFKSFYGFMASGLSKLYDVMNEEAAQFVPRAKEIMKDNIIYQAVMPDEFESNASIKRLVPLKEMESCMIDVQNLCFDAGKITPLMLWGARKSSLDIQWGRSHARNMGTIKDSIVALDTDNDSDESQLYIDPKSFANAYCLAIGLEEIVNAISKDSIYCLKDSLKDLRDSNALYDPEKDGEEDQSASKQIAVFLLNASANDSNFTQLNRFLSCMAPIDDEENENEQNKNQDKLQTIAGHLSDFLAVALVKKAKDLVDAFGGEFTTDASINAIRDKANLPTFVREMFRNKSLHEINKNPYLNTYIACDAILETHYAEIYQYSEIDKDVICTDTNLDKILNSDASKASPQTSTFCLLNQIRSLEQKEKDKGTLIPAPIGKISDVIGNLNAIETAMRLISPAKVVSEAMRNMAAKAMDKIVEIDLSDDIETQNSSYDVDVDNGGSKLPNETPGNTLGKLTAEPALDTRASQRSYA